MVLPYDFGLLLGCALRARTTPKFPSRPPAAQAQASQQGQGPPTSNIPYLSLFVCASAVSYELFDKRKLVRIQLLFPFDAEFAMSAPILFLSAQLRHLLGPQALLYLGVIADIILRPPSLEG